MNKRCNQDPCESEVYIGSLHRVCLQIPYGGYTNCSFFVWSLPGRLYALSAH